MLPLLSAAFFLKDFIYLFMRDRERERERERERGRDTGRGRSRLHAGRLTWGLIPGLQDHTWAEGGAKPLSPPGCPQNMLL